jgi:indoleamine 2,3-dioxygenase
LDVLKGAKTKNQQIFQQGLRDIHLIMQNINRIMDSMWSRSLPQDYNAFRTFIMGTKQQP